MSWSVWNLSDIFCETSVTLFFHAITSVAVIKTAMTVAAKIDCIRSGNTLAEIVLVRSKNVDDSIFVKLEIVLVRSKNVDGSIFVK